jgi:hypothetical protein
MIPVKSRWPQTWGEPLGHSRAHHHCLRSHPVRRSGIAPSSLPLRFGKNEHSHDEGDVGRGFLCRRTRGRHRSPDLRHPSWWGHLVVVNAGCSPLATRVRVLRGQPSRPPAVPVRHRRMERRQLDHFADCVTESLLRTGHLMTFAPARAENLVQETLLRVGRRWEGMRAPILVCRRGDKGSRVPSRVGQPPEVVHRQANP